MALKSIREVIYGKLQDLGLDADTIDILELEELRKGPIAVYHVRSMYAGYYRTLGLWKINTYNSALEGVAFDSESQFLPLESHVRRFQDIAQQQRTIWSSSYGPVSRMIRRFAADNCTSVQQLFYPVNYIRKVVDSALGRLFKRHEGLSSSKPALEIMTRKISELQNAVGDACVLNDLRSFGSRLAFYSAASRNADEISENDVQQAFLFFEAILSVALGQFGVPSKGKLSDPEAIMDAALYEAFSGWRLFSRLRDTQRTPRNLILLLIDTARVMWTMDNFKDLDESRARSYLKDLLK